MFTAMGCGSDEPVVNTIGASSEMGEIECDIDNQYSSSRAYYEKGSASNIYCAKWDKGDQIAMCFDGSDVVRRFNLLKGENSPSATFYGPVPDTYRKILAVYPFDIYKCQTSNSIEVCLPSTINYNAQKVLCGAMPMFAQGTAGALNFYNLMGVLKISVEGNGLLKSISISSIDGYGMSGSGHITVDENNIPSLSFDDNGSIIKINIGALFLSTSAVDIFLPIPAATYESGLKLDFELEGKIETRELRGPLHFDRSVMRTVKPNTINVPFNFANYENKDNEIWYESSVQQSVPNEFDLGVSIISNSFSSYKHLGVITTESPVVKIGGPLFQSPQSVTFVKLPNSVQEIAVNGFKGTSIESFEAPQNLRILGTDAFLGCSKLKRIVLNDGLESLGLDVFGDCPNLESVFIPKSVRIIGAYSFRGSTAHLDHWDGDCPLIDDDRHALYANSAYGMVSEDPIDIDIIAGCNLIEYSIPERALFTQNCAFEGLKNLKKLIIHENFRGFGLVGFISLNSLETIICYATTPPEFNPDENFETKCLKEVRVPQSSIEEYKKADGWKHFADKIVSL